MADYIVIYDPAKQIAAIVNADDRIGFGPAFIGPDAEKALTQFLESIDYDVSAVDSAVLRSWFEGWAGEHFQPSEAPTGPADIGAVVDNGSQGMDAAAHLAEQAAVGNTEIPPPQPADTDPDAAEGTPATVAHDTAAFAELQPEGGNNPPPYEGPCFACNGAGTVALVEGSAPVVCSACRGTGQLPAPVA